MKEELVHIFFSVLRVIIIIYIQNHFFYVCPEIGFAPGCVPPLWFCSKVSQDTDVIGHSPTVTFTIKAERGSQCCFLPVKV